MSVNIYCVVKNGVSQIITLSCSVAIFSSRVILYNFFSQFCSFLVVWELGFWGWGLRLGFRFSGLGFSVDGVCGLWSGAFWVFWGWGSLYKHRKIPLEKKTLDSALGQMST